MQLWILKNTGFCVAFHSWFGIGTKVTKGIRSCMLQKPPKKRMWLRPPSTRVNLRLAKIAPTLPKMKKTAQVVRTRGTAGGKGTP